MKTLLFLAVLAVAAWFVFTHIKQVNQVQQAAVQYAQGLKGDEQGAKTAVQQMNSQTQTLKKSLQEAKTPQ